MPNAAGVGQPIDHHRTCTSTLTPSGSIVGVRPRLVLPVSRTTVSPARRNAAYRGYSAAIVILSDGLPVSGARPCGVARYGDDDGLSFASSERTSARRTLAMTSSPILMSSRPTVINRDRSSLVE